MLKLNNVLNIFFVLIAIFQLSLISHRNGFDIKILLNFYKHNYGILNSLNSKYYFTNDIFLLTNNYNIDIELIDKDPASIQRLTEVTYPSRINYKSNFFFLKNDSTVPENCNKVEKINSITLYDCK